MSKQPHVAYIPLRAKGEPLAAEPPAETADGELKTAMLGDLSRRLFGKRLLVAIPVAAALLTDTPQVAEAGTDGDWTLSGNSLPDASRFLGSTNAQPLTFKTSNATRMTITSGGNVGIGTASPATKLHAVTGAALAIRGQSASSSGIGVHGAATSATGTTLGVYGSSVSGIGVYGATSATDNYFLPGVYGRAIGSGGTGVFGYGPQGNGVLGRSDRDGWAAVAGFNNAGSAGYGVVGDSANGAGMLARGYQGLRGEGRFIGVYGISNGAYGVIGRQTSPTGTGVGVSGTTASTAGNVVATMGEVFPQGAGPSSSGVRGINYSNTFNGIGVWGQHFGSGYGVYGSVAGNGIAVSGLAPSGGYAGYFFGRVHVAGTLSKSAGAFKIDHPLDPANKYLSHSFVESPDMMNIYNGNVTLDKQGEAVVELPAWFEALNQEFRYQLTAIGAPGPNLYIAAEIKGNRFTIAGGKAGMKVSWQVTGIRQDAFATTNRIVVEEEEAGKDRGKYLFPQGFGRPESDRLEYGRQGAADAKPPGATAAADLARAEVSAPAPATEPATPGTSQ